MSSSIRVRSRLPGRVTTGPPCRPPVASTAKAALPAIPCTSPSRMTLEILDHQHAPSLRPLPPDSAAAGVLFNRGCTGGSRCHRPVIFRSSSDQQPCVAVIVVSSAPISWAAQEPAGTSPPSNQGAPMIIYRMFLPLHRRQRLRLRRRTRRSPGPPPAAAGGRAGSRPSTPNGDGRAQPRRIQEGHGGDGQGARQPPAALRRTAPQPPRRSRRAAAAPPMRMAITLRRRPTARPRRTQAAGRTAARREATTAPRPPPRPADIEQRLDAAFTKADADNSGTLTLAEIQECAEAALPPPAASTTARRKPPQRDQ